MGNVRLGILPQTHRWREVVKLLEGEGSLTEIAKASFEAALVSFRHIPNDPGFTEALTEIFKFAESAKTVDFVDRLQVVGFEVGSDASALELLASLRSRIDNSFRRFSNRTDLQEISVNSFGESLMRQTAAELPSLLAAPPRTAQEVVRRQLTGSRFKGLMHEFYSVFTRRYLAYYLSRELARHVGGPGSRFRSIDEHTAFNRAFDTWVRQSVRIADEFTPGWFAKTSYQEGITRQNVSRYAHVAFKKISGELQRGNGHGHGG